MEAQSRPISAPVLTYFAVDRKPILATDASSLKGMGFVLPQLVDGVWKPYRPVHVLFLPNFALLIDHQPLIPTSGSSIVLMNERIVIPSSLQKRCS